MSRLLLPSFALTNPSLSRTNMNNSGPSSSSNLGASPRTSSEASPGASSGASPGAVVNYGERANIFGGVFAGIAQRPIIFCTEEGFKGLLSDFVSGQSIKKQISNIKERRAGST